MYFKSNRFRLFYRLLVLSACEFSLFMQFKAAASADTVQRMLCFFTPLVYLLGFLYFFFLLFAQPAKERPMVRGAVLVSVLAAALLVPFCRDSGYLAFVGTLQYGLFSAEALQFLTYGLFPLLAFFDYLLFVPKGQYKALYPPAGLIFPAVYGLLLCLRAKLGTFSFYIGKAESAYPYLFLDAAKYGSEKVWLTVFCIAIGFLSLGYLLYLLDWALGKIRGRRK